MKIEAVPRLRTAGSAEKISFEFFAPEAQKVQIAGDFNDWNPEKGSLKKMSDGKWKIILQLSPGRYEYRYFVDGNWQNAQSAVECVPNVFGTWNCVVTVQ